PTKPFHLPLLPRYSRVHDIFVTVVPKRPARNAGHCFPSCGAAACATPQRMTPPSTRPFEEPTT
ncbi:hypothetical protein, partial [Burkholderia sp. LMG 13014]|uniref:hypothetical protein n=1 Tax=Burkholderia sp. LMG 13014 TaxID=2709306 RepID=UPI001962714A